MATLRSLNLLKFKFFQTLLNANLKRILIFKCNTNTLNKIQSLEDILIQDTKINRILVSWPAQLINYFHKLLVLKH